MHRRTCTAHDINKILFQDGKQRRQPLRHSTQVPARPSRRATDSATVARPQSDSSLEKDALCAYLRHAA
jgi:hypothetical protein